MHESQLLILVQDAAKRVRKGLGGLKVHLHLEDEYFGRVAELASDWHVKPSPAFKVTPGVAPFYADLSVPGAEVAEQMHTVELGRNPDGSLQVR